MSRLTCKSSESSNCELRMSLQIPTPNTFVVDLISEEMLLYGLIKFQIRIKTIAYKIIDSNDKSLTSLNGVLVKFDNVSKNDFITINFHSTTLNIDKLSFTPDSMWHLIFENKALTSIIEFHFTIEIGRENTQAKILYEDEELTDFELRGDDGSVKVHKCLLAAASPVLKTMLLGGWKEAVDGYVQMKGFSKTTLEDMKAHIYSQPLTSTVSEQLLVLAMRYMITDLEAVCIYNLIKNATAESLSNLFDFAGEHKCEKLKMAILEVTQNDIIDIDIVKDNLIDKDYVNMVLVPTCKSLNIK